MLRALPVPRGIPARLLLAAGLALGLAACQQAPGSDAGPALDQTPGATPEATADPARPVVVALLAPLTTADPGAASAGNALANAGRMAAVDLADPGLELKVYDTLGTPEGAEAAAYRALGEGAALILGPLFGANTPAVAGVAGRAGLNVISFSTDSAVAGGPVFVSGFLPEAEAARIVGFAASRGFGRIGVYHPYTPYGAAALRGAEDGTQTNGARIVVESGYERTFQGIQEGAEPFAGAAVAAGVTAILLPESGKGLQTVAAFMDYHGLDPAAVKYLGLGQWNASATLQEPTLKGGWFPAPDPDRLDVFAALYEARHGARPPFIAVLGYDAVQVAGQLLAEARRTGSRTPFGRAELTRPEGFQGALGPLRFRPDGQAERAMAILEVGAGAFEVADPAPSRLDLGS
jgi:ABC-type branched-subunit amino acid transport system substrate-binding protein